MTVSPLWTPQSQKLWSPSVPPALVHRRTLGGPSTTTPDLFATHTFSNANFGVQQSLDAAASFVGAASSPAGLASSYTVSKPAGIAAGDLVLISVLVLDGSVTSAPSDLTLAELLNTFSPTNSSPSRWQWYLYSKIATGSDPASWTFGLSANWWTSVIAAGYRGTTGIAGAPNWILGSAGVGFDPGNQPIESPPITATRGRRVLALFGTGQFRRDDVITVPGSVTLRQTCQNGYSIHVLTDFTA